LHHSLPQLLQTPQPNVQQLHVTGAFYVMGITLEILNQMPQSC